LDRIDRGAHGPPDQLANPASGTAKDAVAFEASVRRILIRRYDPVEDPPAEIAAIRSMPRAERRGAAARARGHYWSVAPQLAGWNGRIATLEVSKRSSKVASAHTHDRRHGTARHARPEPGNWLDESGEVVQPAVPAFLPPLPADVTLNRLAPRPLAASPRTR
jgi:hypothetical protein